MANKFHEVEAMKPGDQEKAKKEEVSVTKVQEGKTEGQVKI